MRYGIALKSVCRECGQTLRDEDPVFTTDRLEVRPVRGEVRLDGELLHLTPTERRMLVLLVVNLGDLCTYADIYAAISGHDYDPKRHDDQRQGLRVHMHRLRRRLGSVADQIETVPGEMEEGGWRMVAKTPS